MEAFDEIEDIVYLPANPIIKTPLTSMATHAKALENMVALRQYASEIRP